MKMTKVALPFLAVLAFGSVLGCKGAVEVKAVEAPPPPPPPALPPPVAAPALPAMQGAQIEVSGDVEFDTAAFTIKDTANSKAVLAQVLKILQDTPAITRLRIEGHTDSDGTEAANLVLSEKRAAAVVKWLVDKGVDSKRLYPFGCAARDPLAPNTTAEGKAKNRRTELDVEEMSGKKPDGYTAPCAPNPARAK